MVATLACIAVLVAVAYFGFCCVYEIVWRVLRRIDERLRPARQPRAIPYV